MAQLDLAAGDLARRLVAPAFVALVPLFWVVDATYRSSLTTLGRDQGIFQYIAWAIGRGDVDYRDIRDVNGPLVHLIHMIMLALGGRDEHRFHVLDLWATGLSFAFVGACLPGLVRRHQATVLTWSERAAWAAAAWVILSAQYHLYLYWNQAQRESFCDWFLLPSLALQIAPPARTEGGTRARIVIVAALSSITWFGKLNFALFTIVQLGVMLIDHEIRLSRAKIFGWFFVGGLVGATVPIAFMLLYGDIASFARISFIDVPNIYRFIWAKSAQEILSHGGSIGAASLALATSALLIGLVALRDLPRRTLALALAPICGLIGVLVQHKGFDYHFHPVTATTRVGLLVVVVMLWERFGSARKQPQSSGLGRYVALTAALALALDAAVSMKDSPHTRNVWILAGGETPLRRSSQEYFATFRSYDFFPWEMRQAAEYLAESTHRDARVQVYGMDPYLLFLARRQSATPYIYAYDLNVDAALEGGWSNRPTDAQAFRIKLARDTHERDMLDKLRDMPPEAFVFIDSAPLITLQNAWEDFRRSCPESAQWVATHYHAAKSFGEFHVWLRDDSHVPDAPVPDVEDLP